MGGGKGVGTISCPAEYDIVVTAQHVLNNQHATHDELRILLRNAPLSIPFDQRAVFREESDPDLNSDLAILRVVKSQHAALFAAGLTSLDAARCVETEDFDRAEIFYVFGYPDEGRGYDYEKRVLDAQLHCAQGATYRTSDSEPFKHKNRGRPSGGLSWHEWIGGHRRCR